MHSKKVYTITKKIMVILLFATIVFSNAFQSQYYYYNQNTAKINEETEQMLTQIKSYECDIQQMTNFSKLINMMKAKGYQYYPNS